MKKSNYRVILVTGAGASNFLGYPTLRGIKDHISASITDNSAKTTINLWDELDKYSKLTSLEQVIGKLHHYLDVSETVCDDITFHRLIETPPPHSASKNLIGMFSQALTFCYRTMLKHYGPFVCSHKNCDACQFKNQCDYTISFLSNLAEINNGHLHLFTTNYDCSLKTLALKKKTLPIYDHINNNLFFEQGWFGGKGSGTNSVYLHNLHGCVTWSTDSNRGIGGVFETVKPLTELTFEDCPIIDNMGIKLVTESTIENPAFATAFQELRKALRLCECLVVWGHSFRDIELLRALNEEALNRKGRRLSIVNMNLYDSKEAIKQNICSTLGKAPVNIADFDIVDFENDLLRKDFTKEAIKFVKDTLSNQTRKGSTNGYKAKNKAKNKD